MPYCTQCGHAVSPGQRFCGNCGVRLIDSAPDRVPPERPAPIGGLSADRDSFPEPSDTPMLRAPLSALAEHDRSGAPRQILFAAVALVAVLLSAWLGFSWFAARSRTESLQRDVSRGVAETEEPVVPRPIPASESSNNPAEKTDGAVSTSTEVGWTIASASTHDTNDATNVLGSPDGRTATILSGGELTLAMLGGGYVYNGPGPDLRIHGPEGERVSYSIFAKADDDGMWVRFDRNTKGFPHGEAVHDFAIMAWSAFAKS